MCRSGLPLLCLLRVPVDHWRGNQSSWCHQSEGKEKEGDKEGAPGNATGTDMALLSCAGARLGWHSGDLQEQWLVQDSLCMQDFRGWPMAMLNLVPGGAQAERLRTAKATAACLRAFGTPKPRTGQGSGQLFQASPSLRPRGSPPRAAGGGGLTPRLCCCSPLLGPAPALCRLVPRRGLPLRRQTSPAFLGSPPWSNSIPSLSRCSSPEAVTAPLLRCSALARAAVGGSRDPPGPLPA